LCGGGVRMLTHINRESKRKGTPLGAFTSRFKGRKRNLVGPGLPAIHSDAKNKGETGDFLFLFRGTGGSHRGIGKRGWREDHHQKHREDVKKISSYGCPPETKRTRKGKKTGQVKREGRKNG